MARPKRERPQVEDPAVEPVVADADTPPEIKLVPNPESLGGADRARRETSEPQNQGQQPVVERAEPAPQPTSGSAPVKPQRPEPSHAHEAEVVEEEAVPAASAEVDVYKESSVDLHREGGDNSSSNSGLHFEAVQIGDGESLLDLPSAKTNVRSVLLPLRATPAYLKTHKRKVHLLAAMHGITVEEVNVHLLNELAESFPRVDERIKAHEKKMLDEELEAQARALAERRRGL